MTTKARSNRPERDAPDDVTHPVSDHDFDEQTFKSVMRKLAGTACIIGTSNEDGLHGLTATAVCSVSSEPPTILIVVNRSSRTHPHIDAKQAFTLNLLAEGQRAVAELFATKSADQFAQVDHVLLDDSCPVVVDAAAHLHCRVREQLDVGTHTIFVGDVIDGKVGADKPLVYHDAAFWSLKPSA